jgi:hypothetical protein
MGAIRILLVTSAATAGSVMVYGWIFERFVLDFMPLLVLASMIGMVNIWHRLDTRSRTTRRWVFTAVAVLALFGFWANMGFAIAPVPTWTEAQLTNYIHVQQDLSDITGHPLDHYVVVGTPNHCEVPTNSPWRAFGYCDYPRHVPAGTLFVKGPCSELFISTQNLPPYPFVPSGFWVRVEKAPHTPICHSLTRERRPST